MVNVLLTPYGNFLWHERLAIRVVAQSTCATAIAAQNLLLPPTTLLSRTLGGCPNQYTWQSLLPPIDRDLVISRHID